MSAERTPPDEQAFLAGPMRAITAALLRRPGATLFVALLLAVLSIALAATRLGYKTSRVDLLDPDSDYNRRWLEYTREFGDEEDAVVVVEAPTRELVLPVLREISQALEDQSQHFHSIFFEIDQTKLQSKGLYFLDFQSVAGVERFLEQSTPLLQNGSANLSVANMVSLLALQAQAAKAQGVPSPRATGELNRFSASLLASLVEPQRPVSPWPDLTPTAASTEQNPKTLATNNGQAGFVLLRLSQGQGDGFARGTEAIDALRELIALIAASHQAQGVTIGLTGLPIMENDEMRSSQSSMLWASIISFVGVTLLFIAGFGGARHALLANLVLLIGMAWSFGYVTLLVGHLNILSITFAVTLIGIGIDYGVYYVARYMKIRNDGVATDEALLRTTTSVGPAIAAGAATTAVSFLAAGFTSFPGVAELGIVAGGGIVLCCIAQLFVLPAALKLVDRGERGNRMPRPLPVHAWINPLLKTPRLLLLVTGAATIFLALGMRSLWYDHNLLHLQAEGLESIELERKLTSECDQSMWYALSIANSPEELLARKAKFLSLPMVERTEEIVSLAPADSAAKQPIIERIQQRLANLPNRPPFIPNDSLEAVGQALLQAERLAAGPLEDTQCAARLQQARAVLGKMSPVNCQQFLSEFQQRTAGELLARLRGLKNVADPAPPGLRDLPASLVTRYVGQNGRQLLKIYGRGDIWNMEGLRQFVAQVRSVDPQATGNPLQAYEASHEMKNSYEHAAWLALLVIFGVLLFDFRSLRFTLLAALPLGWGLLQTFGLLGWLDIPLNPANMIALPLILGIGVDYGVHMVHELREQKGPYRLSSATAIAVMVDGLTTLAGYGSLMIASHQGLRSLGRVLTLGITCCMFTSLVMLPALLTWMTRNRREPLAATDDFSAESEADRHLSRTDPAEPSVAAPNLEIRRRTSVAAAAAVANS